MSGSGFTINTSAGLKLSTEAETVIVPAMRTSTQRCRHRCLTPCELAHARGARLVSICTGAFALAAAGFLDGRPATTHWRWTDELQRRYPLVEVLPNRLFVDDGDILTSAGVTTGIDLCLHLIRRDHGAAAANTGGTGPRRSATASRRASAVRRTAARRSRAATNSARFATGCWRTLPFRSTSTRSPGAHTCLDARSPVGFARRPGCAPMAWLTDARIDRARELLETTTEPSRTSAASRDSARRPLFERPSTGASASRRRNIGPSSTTARRPRSRAGWSFACDFAAPTSGCGGTHENRCSPGTRSPLYAKCRSPLSRRSPHDDHP